MILLPEASNTSTVIPRLYSQWNTTFRNVKDRKKILVKKPKSNTAGLSFVSCACLVNSRPFRIRSDWSSVNSGYSREENAYNYYIVGIVFIVTFTLSNGSKKTIWRDFKGKNCVVQVGAKYNLSNSLRCFIEKRLVESKQQWFQYMYKVFLIYNLN